MTQELTNDIKSLQTHFGAIWDAASLHLSRDEVNTIGSVYKQITSGRRLNLQCAECVRNALGYIAMWWDTNQPSEPTNKKKK